MLLLINEVIGRAPEYNETGLVGVPLNAVLDWCMGTPAGFAAFRHDAINATFRKILQGVVRVPLQPRIALRASTTRRGGGSAPRPGRSTRIEQFQYKPREKHWGFTSWNDYFTRRFKPGRRPIADPDDDKVIVNACESTPYALKTNVKRQDRFWVKAQPYSLQDMLAGDESAEQFVGGTVYQAYPRRAQLSPLAQPGLGHDPQGVRPGGDLLLGGRVGRRRTPRARSSSQGYLAHVATRAIILIESDDPVIGLVCLMPVGMVRGLFLRHPSRDPAGPPGEEGRGDRLLPVRRLDLLPDLPARRASRDSLPEALRSPRTRIRRSSSSGRRSRRRTDDVRLNLLPLLGFRRRRVSPGRSLGARAGSAGRRDPRTSPGGS